MSIESTITMNLVTKIKENTMSIVFVSGLFTQRLDPVINN